MIRIGSRESELALWQAEKVKGLLEGAGLECEIVKIKSKGDIVLDKPLYELGVKGVFTKSLDIALLNGDIDIAVHSMKDVPTLLPQGIREFAVLERGDIYDVLIPGPGKSSASKTVATGSLRRKAQWLHKFPECEIVGLRGNVNTRIAKVQESKWLGAIFAKAGLERINLLPKNAELLDWMVPAPAQGALMIVGRDNNEKLFGAVNTLNHADSQLAVSIERAFLRTLEGGCTAPIGAKAEVVLESVKFTGSLHSLDGSVELRVEKLCKDASPEMGVVWARELLENGGHELMAEIKAHFEGGKL
tara:strand:- start:331 stop:1239 length:909 start_codon:yes stop_codon:yes gene_type:complete